VPVRLGRLGISKQIFLGARESDLDVDYLKAFVELARGASAKSQRAGSKAIVKSSAPRTR